MSKIQSECRLQKTNSQRENNEIMDIQNLEISVKFKSVHCGDLDLGT